MPKLKLFTGSAAVPEQWKQTLGMERHHHIVKTMVVAALKADIDHVTLRRGFRVGDMRLSRPNSYSNTERMLVEAEVISLDFVGVYVFRAAQKDCPIARVEMDGSLYVMAHFRWDSFRPGESFYVEKKRSW